MDINWNLLAQLVDSNMKSGEKSENEVIETFLAGYKALNEYKDDNNEINVEYALDKIKDLLNKYHH